MRSVNDQAPFLGPTFPTYPGLYEVLRVYAPAVLGTNAYPAWVQQWTPPLNLRDRVTCYVLEPNGARLGPGYYDARLVGSYNGLPLYVTNCCPAGSSSPGP